MDLVKKRSDLELKFLALCQNIVTKDGYELYDLEYRPKGQLLRVFIYNPETLTCVIEDCVAVDHALTPYLEEEWVPESLVLEVSSPGIFRELTQEKHFELAKGEFVKVTLSEGLDEDIIKIDPKVLKNKKIRLELMDFVNGELKFCINNKEVLIPLNKIKKVVMDPDL